MKKKIISFIMMGVLIFSTPTAAFAGTWEGGKQGRWQYLKDNGSYARNEWIYDNGSWYFISLQDYMLSNEIGPGPNYNTGGYNYYFDKSGKMVSGGFFDSGSHYKVYATKEGHLVEDELVIIDGVLYCMQSTSMDTNLTYARDIRIKKSNGEGKYIEVLYSNGKILDPNGKPFAADSELYTTIKYLPKYDSKGNLIGEIKN